eukprot:TRINITY_DN6324_c0_g1_i1.p1 TRINITY_DN6324_c0_g1~~TRINITY_DN6324_c0_g1_i1.p1  ORF type:complete len:100 (+),score=10.34 TRINITY_DN6324_c0_g1_i1:87-386(+)
MGILSGAHWGSHQNLLLNPPTNLFLCTKYQNPPLMTESIGKWFIDTNTRYIGYIPSIISPTAIPPNCFLNTNTNKTNRTQTKIHFHAQNLFKQINQNNN